MLMAITYGDSKFTESLKVNKLTARLIGRADCVKVYTPSMLDKTFKEKNKRILNQARGAGYWLWKPYIILDALNSINDGDYLMYMDAGAYYIRSIKYLIKQLEEDKKDILLSSLLLPNKDWCKRDAFILMECDTDEAKRMHQVEASYLLIKKSNKSVEFIKKWLFYMEDERISTDIPNQCGKPNEEGFKQNRHDQTVLSLLAYKEKVEPYRGISDSSELYRFIRGNQRYNEYSIDAMIQFAREEYYSNRYYKSKYPRIVINTKIRNIRGIKFYWYIIKSFFMAIKVDTYGKYVARKILAEEKDNGTK